MWDFVHSVCYRTGWGGNVEWKKIISSVLCPYVTVLGAGNAFLLSISLHFPCFSADKNLHLSTLIHSSGVLLDFSLLIFSASYLSQKCRLHFTAIDLSSLCATFTFSPLFHSPCLLSDEGGVQQEVHLHLYHTCNVLSTLIAGPEQHGISMTLWKSYACHLKLSSQGSFHKIHEWSRAAFNATCPVSHPSTISIFSSKHKM